MKKLRRYFILTQILFCANTQKPSLIHTILADTVEMCGGSRKLLRILNRLGVTSSADTHDRFVTEVAQAQREKTVWDTLSDNTLTVASADNFDMLQSHAAVYCGDQSRSYHALTMQLVQPNPQIKFSDTITSGPDVTNGPAAAATTNGA